MKEQQGIAFKEACMEGIVPALLIAGAKLNSELAYIFFPEGIPFFVATLIDGCTIAAVCKIVHLVVQCFISAYTALNSAIMVVEKSRMWVMTVKAAKSLWRSWLNMDIFSRKLMIMIAIIILSLALFNITQRSVNLWLPPAYSAAALSFAYLFEKECASRKQNTRRYWLAVLLIFCIIQICLMGISMEAPLYLSSADAWSEIWELMARLPTARSDTVESLRILTAVSLTYYIAKRIYLRHETRIIGYVEWAKQFITRLIRGLSGSKNSLNSLVP